MSPEDFAPYYEVGDFPFNFELIFYNFDVTADIVLEKITNTLEYLPDGKKANWVVSFLVKHRVIYNSSENLSFYQGNIHVLRKQVFGIF